MEVMLGSEVDHCCWGHLRRRAFLHWAFKIHFNAASVNAAASFIFVE